ncbi:MAG TPA: hypothetical protein PKJ97_02130, partial [Candidatus Bilamarchaeaceae archaeon]|nr:hypothetical protein [Candidatus Bilamarchaeaceae archaeon]
LWTKNITLPAAITGEGSVDVDAHNNYVVSTNLANGAEFVMKLDKDGNEIWNFSHFSTGMGGNGTLYDIAITPHEDIVMAGLIRTVGGVRPQLYQYSQTHNSNKFTFANISLNQVDRNLLLHYPVATTGSGISIYFGGETPYVYSEGGASTSVYNLSFENSQDRLSYGEVGLTDSNTYTNMYLRNNLVEVKSENINDYNETAEILFKSLPAYIIYDSPTAKRNGLPCGAYCYDQYPDPPSLTYLMNVTEFTNYSIGMGCLNFTIFEQNNGTYPINLYEDITICRDTYYVNSTMPLLIPMLGNIDIDCNESTIIGNGLGEFLLSNFQGTTLENCTIKTFRDAVRFMNSTAGALSNEYNLTYVNTSDDYIYDSAVDAFGDYVLVGAVGSTHQWWIAKRMANGTEVWNQTLAFSSQGDRAYGVAVDKDNNYVVVGIQKLSSLSGTDMVIAKFYPNGTQAWNRTWDSGGTSDDVGSKVAVDKDNHYIVAGSVKIGFGSSDGLIVKYDSSGNQVWNKTVGMGFDDKFNDIAVDGRNDYIAVGDSWGLGALYWYAVKLDSGNRTLWSTGPAFGDTGTSAYGVAVDHEGYYVLAGAVNESSL